MSTSCRHLHDAIELRPGTARVAQAFLQGGGAAAAADALEELA